MDISTKIHDGSCAVPLHVGASPDFTNARTPTKDTKDRDCEVKHHCPNKKHSSEPKIDFWCTKDIL